MEWNSLEKEIWEKRIANVRGTRVSTLRKGLDEQKAEIERENNAANKRLKEISKRKEDVIKEINDKNMFLDQLKRDEQELSKNIEKGNEELSLINEKIEKLAMSQ